MKNKQEESKIESKVFFGKITPIVIAKNTLVAKKMTEKEYDLVHKVSKKWISWIRKNYH